VLAVKAQVEAAHVLAALHTPTRHASTRPRQ
jgi:hypothetical protein